MHNQSAAQFNQSVERMAAGARHRFHRTQWAAAIAHFYRSVKDRRP
jgi:hypothetical protein